MLVYSLCLAFPSQVRSMLFIFDGFHILSLIFKISIMSSVWICKPTLGLLVYFGWIAQLEGAHHRNHNVPSLSRSKYILNTHNLSYCYLYTVVSSLCPKPALHSVDFGSLFHQKLNSSITLDWGLWMKRIRGKINISC